ncbi:M16 family metallopeptidase [Sphingobacterium sp. LRF_L2]|uniref:M16 family metallopeptidase n=1 Tax=Sphingobacterium sp. LRF_L2 TaxID=3369421 RepID=UPI003F62BCF7
MLKKIIYLFFFLLGAKGTMLSAQPLIQDPLLLKGKLKNGFTYYIYPAQKEAKQSAIQLFVRAGSLQENERQLGLAHFVEHMAFNGSKNYPKNEVITYLESLGVKFGADLNAYTSYDQTVYRIDVTTENAAQLEKAIDIVADWAFELSFDSLEIERERGVIIEEWRTKQGASARLSEQYLPMIFYNSKYALRKPIGTLDILNHFQHATIKQFYRDWYRPELLAIAVVSNQDIKQTERYIKQQFGKAKNPKKAPKHELYSLPMHKDTLFSIATDREEANVDFSYITKLPAITHIADEQTVAKQLLRSFFNGLTKARFDRLRQMNTAYKSGSMSVSNLMGNIGISVGGASLYEDDIQKGIQKYLYEQQRIRTYGFTKTEIEDYRQGYLAQLERSAQLKTDGTAVTVLAAMKDDFYEGNTMTTKTDRNQLLLKLQASIDSASLMKYIADLKIQGNTVIMLTGPDRVKSFLPTKERIQDWFDSIARLEMRPWVDEEIVPTELLKDKPVAGKILRKEYIKEVDLHKWVLSNHTTVYLKQSDGRKDHIQLTGFRRGGTNALDPKEYINATFSQPIIAASGTGDFSRRALSKYLLGNSASAMLVLSKYREGVAANADMKDVHTMFELLHLKWTRPRIDRDVFELQKKNAIDNVRKREHTISSKYNQLILEKIGAEEGDAQIDEERIVDELQYDSIVPVFNKRFSSARGFEFVVIGDFQLDSMENLIEQYIGGLPADEIPVKNETLKTLSSGEDGDILMKAGETDKATVNIIYQDTQAKHDYPDIIKYELLQEILKIKLRENLRERNSGVYGVSVNVSSTSIPSSLLRLRIGFTCAPERREFLMEQVQQEIDLLIAQPDYMTKDLENCKKQLLVSYNKQKEKETFWSAELRNHLYYNFADWSYFTDYAQLLENLTVEDISQTIKNIVTKGKKVQAVLTPEDKK